MKLLLWVLSVGGALGAAYGLYHLEHEVKTMERVLSKVEEGARRDSEAIQVLQAEWSYLNRPERLQELSTRHLSLAPSMLKQIATPASLTDLPRAVARLPEDALSPIEISAVPIPVPKPQAPRRAPVQAAVPVAAPAKPTPAPTPAPAPAPKVTPLPGMTVAAAFRVEDIVIKGRP
jgi:hypothetical protein